MTLQVKRVSGFWNWCKSWEIKIWIYHFLKYSSKAYIGVKSPGMSSVFVTAESEIFRNSQCLKINTGRFLKHFGIQNTSPLMQKQCFFFEILQTSPIIISRPGDFEIVWQWVWHCVENTFPMVHTLTFRTGHDGRDSRGLRSKQVTLGRGETYSMVSMVWSEVEEEWIATIFYVCRLCSVYLTNTLRWTMVHHMNIDNIE